MPRAYSIGGLRFVSQTEVKEFIRGLVGRNLDDVPLRGGDHRFVLDLLGLHQERDAKVGCGVAHVSVRTNFNHGGRTRGFWITRLDGTETDFSWVKCLSPPSHAQDVRKAFRDAIGDQMLEFKRAALSAGPVSCPCTGEPLGLASCHVDHVAPDTFLVLLGHFLAAEGIGYGQVRVRPTSDGDVYNYLDDAGLADRWLKFHRERAKLRLLSRTGNLSHAKL